MLLFTASAGWTVPAPRPAQPNFLIVYGDDLGWQDPKVYDLMETNVVNGFGGTNVYDTPYMDALATDGVLFRQAYSPACVCAPSRAALLTGKHPARLNFTTVSGGAICPQPGSVSSRMMDGYFNRRLELEETTLPELLATNGYLNGHIGKWHLEGPGPLEHGFHYSDGHRGATIGMADRLTGFATTNAADPYQLQDIDGNASTNGYAFDQTTRNALDFLAQAAATNQPFFCYFASYLVHAPWHQRTERLLEKYALRMGYSYPLTGAEVFPEGQLNPFYASMVETFDYNLHQIMNYLRNTDDPRWPGHKLIENTFVFLTSDNGGMEVGDEQGMVTDNYPLDKGKINQEEGGTRVPFIAVGPGIGSNITSDVMINGLDFMPTLLSLAGADIPAGLDGRDLSTLLLADPQDPQLVTNEVNGVRDTMYWLYPHGGQSYATIRKGGWKLFYNFDHVNNGSLNEYRLYQLYDTNGIRVDVEEMTDLWNTETNTAATLGTELKDWLAAVGANVPHYNPKNAGMPNQGQVPAALAHGRTGEIAWVTYETNKAAMARVDLLYTREGYSVNQTWLRKAATITGSGRAEAALPTGTTHYVFNLIDENNFLVSYPDVGTSGDGIPDSAFAISAAPGPYVSGIPQETFYSEDFTAATLGINLVRDSIGFHKGGSGAWEIKGGKLVNTSLVNNTVSEGAVAVIIDLSSLPDPTVDEFTLSFDYEMGEYTETLIAHVWGYIDHNSSSNTAILNHGAQNGNAWESAHPTYMYAYNFGNPEGEWLGANRGESGDAAISLAGFSSPDTYKRTFDLSGYTTASNTLGAYDYLVIAFTRSIAGSAPSMAIDNVQVTVPTSDKYARWAYESGLETTADNSAPYLNAVVNGGLNRDHFEWHKISDSEWTVSEGVLENTSDSGSPHGRVSEGAIARMVDLSGFSSLDTSQLSLRFEYTLAKAGERLHVHLWGCVDINATPTTWVMNLGASNGNAWNSAPTNLMTVYNLGKTNGVFAGTPGTASDTAVIITNAAGPHVYSNTFDLSVNTASPDTVGGYDYIAIGFTREATDSPGSTAAISNITLSAVGGDTLVDFTRVVASGGMMEDPDLDHLFNLLEYALGGNPTNDADDHLLPVGQASPGGFAYVYRRRVDAVERGISYEVQCTSNLTWNSWVTNGCEETGSAPVDAGFEVVTNRILAGDMANIRLEVATE